MTGSSVQRILDQDGLMARLAEVAEAKPRDLVIAWYDEAAQATRTNWFGAWPADIGLARLLLAEIEKPVQQ